MRTSSTDFPFVVIEEVYLKKENIKTEIILVSFWCQCHYEMLTANPAKQS
jgi:hypothetical protein